MLQEGTWVGGEGWMHIAQQALHPHSCRQAFLCALFRLMQWEQLELLSMGGGKARGREQGELWQLVLLSSILPVQPLYPTGVHLPIQEKAVHNFIQ